MNQTTMMTQRWRASRNDKPNTDSKKQGLFLQAGQGSTGEARTDDESQVQIIQPVKKKAGKRGLEGRIQKTQEEKTLSK